MPTEQTPRDRHEHAKTPPRLNDDALEKRTEHEREQVAADRRDDGDGSP